jgi:hypothetical protein
LELVKKRQSVIGSGQWLEFRQGAKRGVKERLAWKTM